MKTHTRHLLTLAILLGFTAQTWAQTSAVPDQISYQGIVTDAGGTPIGNTTPENRTVIFRIWDHATESLAANLIYSEQQVVTISKGEFSVLVGDGTAVTGNPLSHSPNENTKGKPTVTIPTAFGGSTRYIGVAVYDSGGAVAPEISPRQRVVSSAFAYRAKVAENMNGGTITGAVTATGSTFTGGTFNSGTFTGAVTATGGSFTGTGAGLTTLNASNLSSGTVGDARLSSNVALLNRSPQTFSGAINSFSGNVGIGNSNPYELLTVGGNNAQKGIGITTATGDPFLRFYDHNGGTPLNKADIYWNRAGNYLGFNSGGINSSFGGNVGIGTSNPLIPLHIPLAGLQIGFSGTATDNFHFVSDTPGGRGLRLYNGNNGSGTLLMTTLATGNIGIGMTSPAQKLDVAGIVQATSIEVRASGSTPYIDFSSTAGADYHARILWTGTSTNRLDFEAPGYMFNSGAVGIGTAPNASRAKLTVGSVFTSAGVNTPFPQGRYMDNTSTGSSNATWGSGNVSIEAQSNIVCNGVFATSDERIKKVLGQSDAAADLKTLLGIKVTDYIFKDQIANGGQPQKKVIAQQVEKVFPQAVSQGSNTVPDIFKRAAIEADWIMLTTDLKKGDRVKLIDDKDAEAIHEVLEVKKDKFRTAFKTEAKNVFVYGREVNDFRRVDYEAISMLNVSATQQIKKEKDAEVKLLKDENTELKAKLAAQDTRLATLEAQTQRLADLEAKDKAREAKLAAIEKLLLAADKAAVKPVSLKKSIGGAE